MLDHLKGTAKAYAGAGAAGFLAATWADDIAETVAWGIGLSGLSPPAGLQRILTGIAVGAVSWLATYLTSNKPQEGKIEVP